MSINASAELIYGFKIESKTKISHITKYNEDTGEPYKKEVESKFCFLSGDEDGSFVFDDYERRCEPGEIGFIHSGGFGKGQRFLGIIISEIDNIIGCGDEFKEIQKEKLDEAMNIISDFAVKNNIKSNPNFYLISIAG